MLIFYPIEIIDGILEKLKEFIDMRRAQMKEIEEK